MHWLADPRTPGAGPDAPVPRPAVFAAMAAWLALLAIVRYRLGFLAESHWLALYLVAGYAGAFAVLGLGHGWAMLARIPARTWGVLAVSAACICAFWYLGRMDSFWRWGADHVDWSWPLSPLLPFAYFCAGSLVFRLIIPLAWARLQHGWQPAALGLPRPFAPTPDPQPIAWLYVALYLLLLPLVLYASGRADFLARYPLARELLLPDRTLAGGLLLAYFTCYLSVFVAGEGFFRGFVSFGLERDFGGYSVALMLVPYVFVHFGKPESETLGAIVAGTVLGWLALKHRSVWLGVALHFAVAVTMDLLALRGHGVRLQ